MVKMGIVNFTEKTLKDNFQGLRKNIMLCFMIFCILFHTLFHTYHE